ncbi:MAG TPA: hypothetical protein VHH35_09315 [Pyrinomonadaceae bacterium]|nr:hypothetical protein [Pyrinomonadaceae bacterium]
MAHDRMMNDDLDRKMGRSGQEGDYGKQDFGKQQTPGRNPQQGQQTGQKGAGQHNKPSQAEGEDFDEYGSGGASGASGKNRQNR